MSRLTSRAPFNKPSAFDAFPPRPAPLSPPETEMEPALLVQSDSRQEGAPLETVSQQAPVVTESPAAHFRRAPSLAYNVNSFSRREPRSTLGQLRWLIMVVPSSSLIHEPPSLGHTLSSAPAGRFSNGILMPLFPTLYGQLTAIAREFNMPSTAGLCTYLQISEPGTSMLTPRISDESWQLLWGHFFAGDERTVQLPPHGLPISGRIEFDIDLRKAKWFDAWMGRSRLEKGDADTIPRAPSVALTHLRNESWASFFPSDIGVGESSSPPEANPPVTALPSRQRQGPRPLLLERRDIGSVRSFTRHTSRAPSISPELPALDASKPDIEPVTEVTLPPKALSPVTQEEHEPQTARQVDLQKKVHQWRQTSSVNGTASNALAAAGQPSLDPINMPSGVDVELDLDDFSWSVSSAGPPSESVVSADFPDPLPSVHLLGRMQGSVCLTPSVATSFGPPDYDGPDSPISCVSRRPSPDLGMRMIDYVPLTPTTATSWGPNDSLSPIQGEFEDEYSAASVDIALNDTGSYPETSYVQSAPPGGSTTRLAVSGKHGSYIPCEALPHYPDFDGLYPPVPRAACVPDDSSQLVGLPAPGYPFMSVYPSVYPWNLQEIYGPSQPVDVQAVAWHEMADAHGGISVQLSVHSGYPTFTLYPVPAGYPSFEIYPSILPKSPMPLVPSVRLASCYPIIEVYEPVYPHLVIYPQVQLNGNEASPSSPINPRKRAPTPGPNRTHAHATRSPPAPFDESETSLRESRSPVQKHLAISSLPAVAAKNVAPPRRARLTHLDLHRRVFGLDSNPESSGRKKTLPGPRRRKTHDELHRMVFGDPSPDIPASDDFTSDLRHHISASSTGAVQRVPGALSTQVPTDVSPQYGGTGSTSSHVSEDYINSHNAIAEVPQHNRLRRRSRSNTANSRVLLPPSPSFPFLPPTLTAGETPPPSASVTDMRTSGTSPSSISARPSPKITKSRLSRSARSFSVSDTTIPTGESIVLNHARLKNVPVLPDGAASQGLNARGRRHSRSSSEAHERNSRRQSVVLGRTKNFAVPNEQSAEIPNTLAAFSLASVIRPDSKLGRPMPPFA